MRAVELFCGAGGMTEGLKQAGWNVVFGYDYWAPALKVYKANHPKTIFRGHPRSRLSTKLEAKLDLSDVLSVAYDLEDLEIDMICGGPPCQDYSNAGKRVEGNKARMTVAFASAIVTRRPEWFFMENVYNALKSKTYQKARKIFKRAGYGLSEEVLDASYYGVPQSRKRLIVIGRLGERDGFLRSALLGAASNEPMTVRDAFGVSIGVHPGAGYPEDTRAIYIPRRKGRTVISIDEPCLTIISSARTPRKENPEEHKPKGKNGKPDFAPPDGMPLLTFHETALLQGFPADYKWTDIAEGKHAGGLAVGNSVPPPLAAAIGRAIKDRQEGKSIPAIPPEYDDWLRVTKGLSGGVARNRKSQLNRARRFLKGRTYSNPSLEIAALEATEEYRALIETTRSDLKKSLALFVEWQDVYVPRQERKAAEIDKLKTDFREYEFPRKSRRAVLKRYEELFEAGNDDAAQIVRTNPPLLHYLYPESLDDWQMEGEGDMERWQQIRAKKRANV